MLKKYALVLGLAFLSACGDTPPAENNIQPDEAVRADQNLLAVSSQANKIVLRKDSLNKDYLLRGHLIPQLEAPTGNSLTSRVVTFKQIDGDVLMFEVTAGHVVTDRMPSEIILASFPILAQDANTITVDWNRGMNKAFVTEGWYGSDDEGGGNYEPATEIVNVATGYVSEVKMLDKTASIRHKIQATGTTKDGKTVVVPFEVQSYLQPYNPSPDFDARIQPADAFKTFGYFEVRPVLELVSGMGVTRISKWDIRNPITYYISANTPEYVRQSVMDGILVWNRAFGKEVLKTEVAPEGVSAPTLGYNIVQWVEWDTAGFAYADANMDPRSGEILQANAYLTSVFATSNLRRAHQLLRKLESAKRPAMYRVGKAPMGGRLCDYDMSDRFAAGLRQVVSQAGATDEDVKFFVAAALREVVAHEIGHTLGLRHNFAGSLATTLSPEELAESYQRHLTSRGEDFDASKTVTSSIMDYLDVPESQITGNLYHKVEGYIPNYDRLAIQNAYVKNAGIKASDVPAFCTDSHLEAYADCKQFDTGSSVLVSRGLFLVKPFEAAPQTVVEQYYSAKNAAVDLGRVGFSTQRLLAGYKEELDLFLSSFAKNARYIKVESKLATIDELTRVTELPALVNAHLQSQIDELKLPQRNLDLNTILTALVKQGAIAQTLGTELSRLLTKEPYASAFTPDEKALINNRAATFFALLEKTAVEQIVATLLLGEDVGADINGGLPFLEQLENAHSAVAEKIILTNSGKDVVDASYLGTSVKFPERFYSTGLRAKAAQTFAGKGPVTDWQSRNASSILDKLDAEYASLLQTMPSTNNVDPFDARELPKLEQDMSRPLYRWFQGEVIVLNNF